MTFDPQLATAEMQGISIIVQHHLRCSREAKDLKTCLQFLGILTKLAKDAESRVISMKQAHRCECGFVPNKLTVRKCPRCGKEL